MPQLFPDQIRSDGDRTFTTLRGNLHASSKTCHIFRRISLVEDFISIVENFISIVDNFISIVQNIFRLVAENIISIVENYFDSREYYFDGREYYMCMVGRSGILFPYLRIITLSQVSRFDTVRMFIVKSKQNAKS